RTQYLLAEAQDVCGEKSEAAAKFEELAANTELSSLVWAARSAKHLPGYDSAAWPELLTAAILHAEQQAQRSNSKVTWLYIAGILGLASGQTDSARTELRDALLLPDSRLAHHYIRVALSDSAQPQ